MNSIYNTYNSYIGLVEIPYCITEEIDTMNYDGKINKYYFTTITCPYCNLKTNNHSIFLSSKEEGNIKDKNIENFIGKEEMNIIVNHITLEHDIIERIVNVEFNEEEKIMTISYIKKNKNPYLKRKISIVY
jgi:hypothetical protein